MYSLCADFAKIEAEKLANPDVDKTLTNIPSDLLASNPTSVLKVTVSGMDEMMKKAMDNAQDGLKASLRLAEAAMKEAQEGHKASVNVA